MTHQVHIIGGGLAGSEAAWQLAEAGVKVRLSEMRGSGEMTPAHQTDGLAELVCSNSFRSDDAVSNAVGLLHAEMRALGSVITCMVTTLLTFGLLALCRTPVLRHLNPSP